MLYNTTLTDMETGYKAFTIEVLRAIEPLRESDFRIEPELTAKICRGGFRVYELPIAYYGRSLRRGQEDHLARRLPCRVGARQVPLQGLVRRLGGPVMLGRAKTERGKDAGSVHSRRIPMGATEDAASRRFAAERARVTFGAVH